MARMTTSPRALPVTLACLGAFASFACQPLPDVGSSSSSSNDDEGGAEDDGGTFGGGTWGGGEGDDDGDGGQQPTVDCDPTLVDACGSAGKCTVVENAGTRNHYTCVDDDGTLLPGDPCQPDPTTGIDGCAKGTVCLGDESGTGTCVALCFQNADCSMGLCLRDAIDQVPFCSAECLPNETSCAEPLQCRRTDDRFTCQFAREDDDGATGAECESLQSDAGCAEGYVCLSGPVVPGCASSNCCTSVCDQTDASACGDLVCGELFTAPAPGFEDVGACFVPT